MLYAIRRKVFGELKRGGKLTTGTGRSYEERWNVGDTSRSGKETTSNEQDRLVIRLAGMDRDPAGLEIFDDIFRKLAGDAVCKSEDGGESTSSRAAQRHGVVPRRRRLPDSINSRSMFVCESTRRKACNRQRNTESETGKFRERSGACETKGGIPHRYAAILPVAAVNGVSAR